MLRSLSPLQLALGVALGGSLLAVFVPTFARNLRASRLAEPLDGLQQIAAAASLLAAGVPTELAYPESAPRTPADVPAGKTAVDPPGTWNHPTWRRLGFRKTERHSFSFSFESESRPEGAFFIARSFGDLDGDGELSHFSIYGEIRGQAPPALYPVRIEREVE
jgi:hypothetical protein